MRKTHITKQFDSNNDDSRPVLTDKSDDEEEDDDVPEEGGVRRYACRETGLATSGPNPNQDVIDQVVFSTSMDTIGLHLNLLAFSASTACEHVRNYARQSLPSPSNSKRCSSLSSLVLIHSETLAFKQLTPSAAILRE